MIAKLRDIKCCQPCCVLARTCDFSPIYIFKFQAVLFLTRGPGSSVSIVTDYGLDGPGIESRWGEIFRPSRPALGPSQPPVQWVPGLSRG